MPYPVKLRNSLGLGLARGATAINVLWYNKTTGVINCDATIECNEELILCL